jgi:hypothetical protein
MKVCLAGFQIRHDAYCPCCLASGAVGVIERNGKKETVSGRAGGLNALRSLR